MYSSASMSNLPGSAFNGGFDESIGAGSHAAAVSRVSSAIPSSAYVAIPQPGPQSGSASPELPEEFVGVSGVLRRLLLQIEMTARQVQIAVFEGEPGVGKHLLARLVHASSFVSAMPFRRYDAREWLASDPESLPGTLYLDNVDLLAETGQRLLLDFVRQLEAHYEHIKQDQDNAAQRMLLLVSSHQNLRQLSARGEFIPELADRLSSVRFAIPPLRERREDIAPLTQMLIERVCKRYRQPVAVLAPGTLEKLLQYRWPGNVRELACTIEAAILESDSGVLRPAHLALLSASETAAAPVTAVNPSLSPSPRHAHTGELSHRNLKSGSIGHDETEDLTLDTAIRRHMLYVLDRNRGNKLRAARQLSISRSTLYRILGGGSALGS